jgi:8-oxo-dGDP phosphatase
VTADGYEVRGTELVYDGQLSRVRVDRVRMPDGDVVDREVVEHPSAVAVVPIDDEGRVVLLRQYRHPVGGHVLEIPAGKLDVSGEAAADAAARELHEEVGMVAGRLEELVTFDNSSGWTDERTTVYLARDVRDEERPAGFVPTAEEAAMEVVRMPLAEAVAAARRGEVPDAKTLIGLLLADGR